MLLGQCWVNERDIYFIDHAGTPHRLTAKNVSSLNDVMRSIFADKNSICLSADGIESSLSACILGMLPTTAQRRALSQGLLGDIIHGAGGIDKILRSHDVAAPSGDLLVGAKINSEKPRHSGGMGMGI